MEPSEPKRRLAAILAADVAEYTRLVEEDTAATVAAWTAARDEVVRPILSARGGRIVKFTGDGFLAEFVSVEDAVEAAIESQGALAGGRLSFRMGIHLGDIMDDGQDIHGEGVNIAARLEALADPGCVCVSGAVHEQVHNRLPHTFVDLGERKMKHVTSPVRVYALSLAAELDKHVQPVGTSEPERPSIAILPFNNMSGDVEQEYFSDGITDDIITALSRFHDLFVIARNSSFVYRGTSTDVRKIGQELGVGYVLEGSVRRAGLRVRVTAQLVETTSGSHVWAERFDRELEDVFAVQDEITESVAAAVGRRIGVFAAQNVHGRDSSALAAWEITARAEWHINNPTRHGLEEARGLCLEAIQKWPEYGPAHGLFALVNALESALGFSDTSHKELLSQAEVSARRAIELDPDDERARTRLSNVLWLTGYHEDALREGEMALRINPNYAVALGTVGYVHATSGKGYYKDAVECFDRAFRLSPHDPSLVYWYLYRGLAELLVGHHDAAIKWCRDSLQRNEKFATAYRVMTVAYIDKGESDRAVTSLSDVYRYDPSFTIRAYSERVGPQFRYSRDLEHMLNGLRAAGAKES